MSGRYMLGGAVLVAAGTLVTQASAQDKRLTAIDAYVEKARQDWRGPAVPPAIPKDDSIVFAKGYGVLEVGKPAPANENTLFAIGSSSKAFTTASLAIL